MFPRPKSSLLKIESVCGQPYLAPETCDFCNGAKIPAPCRHFCTVPVFRPSEGRVHPLTKALICSLVTCGECQSIHCNDPVNICLKHWKIQQPVRPPGGDGDRSDEPHKNDSATTNDAGGVSHSKKPKQCKLLNHFLHDTIMKMNNLLFLVLTNFFHD
jgi:hypothetical protein